nr:transposase, MuDR [Tanacetum cinerariifolium]
MGNEHLDTVSATISNEFIKSSVENLVPNPSESEGENECDVPAHEEFTTFSNVLFDADYEFDSSDDQSLYDEDVLEKIFSNHLFDKEIISMKIDQHHFNAESDLIKSLLNHNSSIISSSSKIDSLFDEFVGELTLLKLIPSGIDKTDCYITNEIRFTKRLLYDNSSPRPLEEFVSKNSNAKIESFSLSPIPIKDSDSLMEEIDLSFTPDYPMPPGIKEDDYDSERDIPILKELLDSYSLSLPENESYHFDIPSSSRPPAKPPDGNTGTLNIKMMGDISEQKVYLARAKELFAWTPIFLDCKVLECISDDDVLHSASNNYVGPQLGGDDLVVDSDVEGVSNTIFDDNLASPVNSVCQSSEKEGEQQSVDLFGLYDLLKKHPKGIDTGFVKESSPSVHSKVMNNFEEVYVKEVSKGNSKFRHSHNHTGRMYVGGRVDIFDMVVIDLFTVVALNMMVLKLDYTGKSEPMFYNYLKPLTSLDEGLYALACEEDVHCMGTLVRSFKLIKVYIEHGVTDLDSYLRAPWFRATLEEITDEDDDVIRQLSFDETELDKEAGFADVTGEEPGVGRTYEPILSEVSNQEPIMAEVRNEVPIVIEVGTQEFSVEDVVVEDYVSSREDVEQGEDVDVINADGFDSDLGNDEEKNNKKRRLAELRIEMEGIINASGQWKMNLKLYKNDGVRIRARCDKKVPVFTMSQGTGPTGPNHKIEAGPSRSSDPTTRSKKGRIQIFEQVRINLDIPVKAVQEQLQRELEVQISMSKAFRAKAKAEREIRGDHILHYSMLRDYCLGDDIDLHPNSNFTFISDIQKAAPPPETWVNPCYWLSTWKETYSHKIQPICGTKYRKRSTCPTTLLPPKRHVQVTRKKNGVGGINAEASGSASGQAQQTKPAVGQNGSGRSGADAIIGLFVGEGRTGVASQGSSRSRWKKRRVQTERINPQKRTPTQSASQLSTRQHVVLLSKQRICSSKQYGIFSEFNTVYCHSTDIYSGTSYWSFYSCSLVKKKITMPGPITKEYISTTSKSFVSNDINGKMIKKNFIEIKGTFLLKFVTTVFTGMMKKMCAASEWFTKECIGTIYIWDDLVERFVLKFYNLCDHEETEDEDDLDVIENDLEIFKSDDDLFKFDSPLCIAFEEFNHLLKIPDLFTYETQKIKTYDEYEQELNNKTQGLEKPWSKNGVPYQICDHICEPYRFKNRKTKWPTCNSDIDGFCNVEELPGMFQIESMTYFQDHKWITYSTLRKLTLYAVSTSLYTAYPDKGTDVMKDTVRQKNVCEEEVLLNNNIGKQIGDFVDMPSEAVEQRMDANVPNEIDGAKGEQKKGIKHCKRWYWNDPELENKRYRTQLYEMHLLLNPSQKEELENELTSREELVVLQVEFANMKGQMQELMEEFKKSQNMLSFGSQLQ